MEFLHAHDRMASLLPTVARMTALQKDCGAILPDMFAACEVLQFEADRLVMAAPSAALAARLKHVLPSLREGLAQRGWQVNAIKIKVQVGQAAPPARPPKRIALTTTALQAFAELEQSLEKKPHTDALRTALATMLRRHQQQR